MLEEENYGTVVSIDIDAYGSKRLKLQKIEVNVIQADARNILLKNEIFEAIFMTEVLDYILRLKRFLKSVIEPSNLMVFFSFGNKSSIKQKLIKLRGKPYTHTYDRIMDWLSAPDFL